MSTASFEDHVKRLFVKPFDRNDNTGRKLHAMLGLAGEVGELADAIKRPWIYGAEPDLENVLEECGDLLFYLVALMNEYGFTLEQAMAHNVAKLAKRYPDGYTDEAARERADKHDATEQAFSEITEEHLKAAAEMFKPACRPWSEIAKSMQPFCVESMVDREPHSNTGDGSMKYVMTSVVKLGHVIDVLKDAMCADEDLAWAWHCNVAVCFMDQGGSHEAANRAAARFMRLAFGVDVMQFEIWKRIARDWKDEDMLRRSLEDIKAGRTVKHEEVKRQVESREPHSNTGDVTVRKECDQPAGELREWWVNLKHDDDSCWAWCNEKFALSSADEDDEIIHVREVPSPERVREALDVFVNKNRCPSWEDYKAYKLPRAAQIITLLRSLGIDTEGL